MSSEIMLAGEIGLNTTAYSNAVTSIALAEDVKIEKISAGEGTHSGTIDINGFVWHTGTNTAGELGFGDNAQRKVFTKTGETVITLNIEDNILHIDIGEIKTLNCILENTFNLKVDLIDDVQSNFTLAIADEGLVTLSDKTIIGKVYGKTTGTVTHTATGRTREIAIRIIKGMESLVQGVRDTDLPDGSYDILVKDEIYPVEVINVYPENGEDTIKYLLQDGQTSRIISLGDTQAEYKTLIVKYHGNLQIDKGITVTASNVNKLTYKKGMYLCVLGDIHNNGNISMTARGTYNVAGQNVYLWKNIDSSYEFVPKVGGLGAAGAYLPRIVGRGDSQSANGLPGGNGIKRALAGGGSRCSIWWLEQW
ncbi:MAG: hypothetical protein K2H53_05475 [Clostridia bacterium]|nr:hypothetical protein [Clostridia bacterium]